MTETENAIDVLQGAQRNKAYITAILATDAADSERSVHVKFTSEESAILFAAAVKALKARDE